MKHCHVLTSFFVVLFLTLFLFSCSKDEVEDKTSPSDPTEQKQEDLPAPEESARYYVKYEVSFQTQHINANRVIKFTNENGEQEIKLDERSTIVTWEGTYGPVKKGFMAKLDCSTPSYDYSVSIHARIYICREQEPFVIKAEDTDRFVYLKYTIDF